MDGDSTPPLSPISLFLILSNFPSIPPLNHSAPSAPLLWPPFALLKVFVLLLRAKVWTRLLCGGGEGDGRACDLSLQQKESVCVRARGCACVSRYTLRLLLCECISSYPLIRVTDFINSLGLMCDSVTPAFHTSSFTLLSRHPGP